MMACEWWFIMVREMGFSTEPVIFPNDLLMVMIKIHSVSFDRHG
jgi:hypothetical protein